MLTETYISSLGSTDTFVFSADKPRINKQIKTSGDNTCFKMEKDSFLVSYSF